MSDTAVESTVEFEGSPNQALEAVGEAAEIWGGEWQRLGTGGQLVIPASAGIRHGHIKANISTRHHSGKVEVALATESSRYRLHFASFFVLLMGALGGLFLVVVPFFPALMPLIPAGILLSLAAWFLVVARVRTRGSVEFLELVRELVEAPPLPPEADSPEPG